jgi:hypothetical protein
MKKNIVLITLFILPIVAYLFFASGVNSFAKLPTITKAIPDVNNWKSIDGKPVSLTNKITILGFTGNNVLKNKGGFFNLSQKIYDKNKEFKDFQFVMIAPLGSENQVEEMIQKLKTLTTDTSGWHFVFASSEEIKTFYSKMNLVGNLDDQFRTPNVFIVDKNRNLRGRKGRSEKGKEEYKEGYDIDKVSELYNEMTDDVKIILAEYRLALKKNNNASRKI